MYLRLSHAGDGDDKQFSYVHEIVKKSVDADENSCKQASKQLRFHDEEPLLPRTIAVQQLSKCSRTIRKIFLVSLVQNLIVMLGLRDRPYQKTNSQLLSRVLAVTERFCSKLEANFFLVGLFGCMTTACLLSMRTSSYLFHAQLISADVITVVIMFITGVLLRDLNHIIIVLTEYVGFNILVQFPALVLFPCLWLIIGACYLMVCNASNELTNESVAVSKGIVLIGSLRSNDSLVPCLVSYLTFNCCRQHILTETMTREYAHDTEDERLRYAGNRETRDADEWLSSPSQTHTIDDSDSAASLSSPSLLPSTEAVSMEAVVIANVVMGAVFNALFSPLWQRVAAGLFSWLTPEYVEPFNEELSFGSSRIALEELLYFLFLPTACGMLVRKLWKEWRRRGVESSREELVRIVNRIME